MALDVTSSAFQHQGTIPRVNTCDGEDVSPPLRWSEPARPAVSFAVISDDPDAPVGTWVHWVLFNLPAETRELVENAEGASGLPAGALQGVTDFRRLGYGGPCPPPGKPHRYFFKVYALDRTLDLDAGATKADVERAMRGCILDQGELVGRYGR